VCGVGFGELQFIFDGASDVCYDLAFPVTDGAWTKVVVAWRDLIPVLPGPRAKPLGTRDRNRPPRLSVL
jgi:hypothetical protein